MPHDKLTNKEQTTLWELARGRLQLKKLKPTVSRELVDRLRTQLPDRREGESLGDLIRQADKHEPLDAEINIFNPKPIKQYTAVSEFTRLAADSSDGDLPLPNLDTPLESTDGQFRLTVSKVDNNIELSIQALGLATDQFANRDIGLVDRHNQNELVAQITLDEDGDGATRVDDSTQIRHALLKPIIVLVE